MRTIYVFGANKNLRLLIEWKIKKRVEEQFNAFITGFNELIPADLVNVFDERELELLIGGIADIDVEDWKKHTDYRGYQESDEVIQNFWKVIRTWDAEQKSRLLQFATGTSRIPVNGFKDLQGSDGPRRFTIEKAGEINALPKSHTWYVQTFFVNRYMRGTRTNEYSTVSIDSIYRLTSHMMYYNRSWRRRLKRHWALDRSRHVDRYVRFDEKSIMVYAFLRQCFGIIVLRMLHVTTGCLHLRQCFR